MSGAYDKVSMSFVMIMRKVELLFKDSLLYPKTRARRRRNDDCIEGAESSKNRCKFYSFFLTHLSYESDISSTLLCFIFIHSHTMLYEADTKLFMLPNLVNEFE